MSDQKDEEVKASIIEAAKSVFQKWGLNKTTMEDIAREAGKAKSTLYYYFKSKDEIFETIVMIELNIIVDNAKASIQSEMTSRQKLKTIITSLLLNTKKTVSIYPLVRGDVKGNKQVIDKILKEMDVIIESVFVELLKEGLDSGELNFLREDQLGKTANAITSIMHGLGLYLFLDNDDVEKIDLVTKIIAEGI